MYERFTDRARTVMKLTNQEAHRFNHEYIGTEHILLAIAKEGSGTAAGVLKSFSLALRRIRMEVEKFVQSGPDMVTAKQLPLTPRARKVIAFAFEESLNLGDDRVGTGHLLLGVLRESHGVGAQVINELLLESDAVRGELLARLGFDSSSYVGEVGDVLDLGVCQTLLWNALCLARHSRHAQVGTLHMLIALLDGDGGQTHKVLVQLGVDAERLLNSARQLANLMPRAPGADKPEFAPRLQDVVRGAADVARSMGHTTVNDGHMLISLLSRGASAAAVILKHHGVELEPARAALRRIHQE